MTSPQQAQQILQDRVFIITGARGAIAGAINTAFRNAGAQLALADRPGNAEAARDRLGAGLAVPVDLSSLEGAQAMVAATVKHYGRLDGLIHTVGGFMTGKVSDAKPEDYQRMFDLNVRTLFNAVVAALPEITRQDNGFVGGIAAGQVARGAGPGVALYTASKGAVALFLKSLDGELKGSSAKAGVVYPMGAVDTPANRRDMPEVDPQSWIDPAEIGAAFVHLASRSSRGRVLEIQVFPPR